MKFKRIICCLMALVMLLISTTVYAGTNWDSGDAGELSEALDGENVWLIRDSSGRVIECAEGLRVTIYDAENETKVYNTIDISGNSRIAGVSDICYFADNGTNELIPKTTWLEAGYIGTTYNDATAASTIKFHNKVASKVKINGYRSEYVPALANLTIISEDNTANLEAIRSLIGDENFLKNLCDLISGLEYDDFADGKYKIAFEPIAYMTIAGSAWVLTATECGILDKYMLDILGSTIGALKTKLGPLTHSQMPLSAFLAYKEVGVAAFSASGNDIGYSNSGEIRYNNSCIIRCMGIGVLSEVASEGEVETAVTSMVQYHTDTDVYTSFDFVNVGNTDYIATAAFSIYNSEGETPKTMEGPTGQKYAIDATPSYTYDENGNINGTSGIAYTYGYTSKETDMQYCDANDTIKVFADNPDYEDDPYGEPPYIEVGKFKDGEVTKSTGGAEIDYVVKGVSGKDIASGTVRFSCPSDEEAMGWFEWHTPSKAQDISITLTAKDSDILLVGADGHRYRSITLNAAIKKVEEITPPDPKVTDTRPSWQRIYNESSVAEKLSDYAAQEDATELTWYVWAYDWRQEELTSKLNRINYITSLSDANGSYMGASYVVYEYWADRYGVDNSYYIGGGEHNDGGQLKKKIYPGAVILSGDPYKVEYSVSLTADIAIMPSEHCHTATYGESSDTYTMKSGYGFEIEVNTHLSGDTVFCTGGQHANVLFPEFNYNLRSSADYNRLLEEVGGVWVFKENEYSTYDDRVHFTPIWYPDNKFYTVYAEVFDIWCPAGQLSVRMTDSMIIRGNVYDDWHIAPT